MKVQNRSAVSPIIATLLLIAIAVASGIIVYVFTGSLAGSLTKSGGSQVTDQISLDAYNYATISNGVTLYLRNTGTSTLAISAFYFNGNLNDSSTVVVTVPTTCSGTLAPGSACSVVLKGSLPLAAVAGTANSVKIVTRDGAQVTYNVVAGQTG